MNFLSRLVKSPFKTISRQFCSIVEEITVQTFCDIQVTVPFNVRIQPLDVLKYHNCDLLRIELQGIKSERNSVKHIQDGNNIKIFASTEDYDEDTTCNIEAPVKANLMINAKGNISAGVFSGSKLILKSSKGSIFVNKFQGETIDLTTQNGNVAMKGAVVASNIQVLVEKSGSIKAKRMQGLNANLKTNKGSITVDSSYCDSGVFEAQNGDLNLQNLHKNSKIFLKNGKLSLTGLDGQLEAHLENASAEIQISRILEDSTISLNENSDLQLQLSEECQENTMFEINTKNHTLDPSIKLIPSTNKDTLYLMPTTEEYKHVLVNCENGSVHIQNSSWIDMLKLMKK